TRFAAIDHTRSFDLHRLESSNGVSVLVTHIARAARVHGLIETSLHRNHRECRLRGSDLPVERHFLTGFVKCNNLRPLIQLRDDENVGPASPRLAVFCHRHVELDRSNLSECSGETALASSRYC